MDVFGSSSYSGSYHPQVAYDPYGYGYDASETSSSSGYYTMQSGASYGSDFTAGIFGWAPPQPYHHPKDISQSQSLSERSEMFYNSERLPYGMNIQDYRADWVSGRLWDLAPATVWWPYHYSMGIEQGIGIPCSDPKLFSKFELKSAMAKVVGMKNIEAGIGCGVDVGHGFGVVFQYGFLHTVDEVSESDYKACSASNSIQTYNDQNTKITLSKAGSRYFICGTPGHCSGGMKLAVTVADSSTPSTPEGSTPSTSTPSTPSSGAQPSSKTPSTTSTTKINGATGSGFHAGKLGMLLVLGHVLMG
ncbi:hypothetical protein COCNU_07G004890 [Cocos nucifera]|uniref:Phytocyanin domain-containing protein n=1 Tax=Cocos nucifera TaxID=13894 RepID=A0A8K0IF65_COCNU|nr:hypothetical protein COCNU_07G004890 [Cocos nucifera]